MHDCYDFLREKPNRWKVLRVGKTHSQSWERAVCENFISLLAKGSELISDRRTGCILKKKKSVLTRTQFNSEQMKMYRAGLSCFIFLFLSSKKYLNIQYSKCFVSKTSRGSQWRRSLTRAALQFWGTSQDLMWHVCQNAEGGPMLSKKKKNAFISTGDLKTISG